MLPWPRSPRALPARLRPRRTQVLRPQPLVGLHDALLRHRERDAAARGVGGDHLDEDLVADRVAAPAGADLQPLVLLVELHVLAQRFGGHQALDEYFLQLAEEAELR